MTEFIEFSMMELLNETTDRSIKRFL